jgi:hypothetical protein
MEYLLNNDSVINNIEKNAPIRTKDTLLMSLMKNSNNMNTVRNELIKYTQFAADPLEIPFDFTMRNVIQTCMDYDKPDAMADQAN